MSDSRQWHEENRLSWNAATIAHNSHKRDQAAFLRQGGSTLFPEEQELLGPLTGLSLLHLQCNCGQDTLSLAQLGATVTGVDISDEAITFAQQLSIDAEIPVTFRRSDVYDWLSEAAVQTEQFDRVFSSYGAICWLSDLSSWATGIAAVLKTGGRFVLVEFHPGSMIFAEDWSHRYNYFGDGKPLVDESGIHDYVGLSGSALAPSGFTPGVQNFHNPHRANEFQWATSDVITALLKAGLTLEIFKEYPYANGAKLFEQMRETPDHRLWPPADKPNLPLMYAIVARKNG